jgi:hypothetical protein
VTSSRIQAVVDLDPDDDDDSDSDIDVDVDSSTTEDDGLANTELSASDSHVLVSAQPPDVLLPPDEAKELSGNPEVLLPADVIGDPPSDDCDTPDIDFSFMYRNQVLHDPLWVALDDVKEGAGEGDTDLGGLEDSDDIDELDDDGYIDWAKFEIGGTGELSAWDQLGAGYDREFASIGMSCYKSAQRSG